jgi:hypothetical protein
VGAERAHQLGGACAAHGGHLSTEVAGELDGEATHAARAPEDQHPLARLDTGEVAEELVGRAPAVGGGGGGSEGDPLGDAVEGAVLIHHQLLGPGAVVDEPEDGVPDDEAADLGADLHDAASEAGALDGGPGSGPAEQQPADEARGRREVGRAQAQVAAGDRAGHDLDEDLGGAGTGGLALGELEQLGGTVGGGEGGMHGRLRLGTLPLYGSLSAWKTADSVHVVCMDAWTGPASNSTGTAPAPSS